MSFLVRCLVLKCLTYFQQDFTLEKWKGFNEIAAGLVSEQGEDFFEMSGLEKGEYLRIAIDAYVDGSF